MGAGRLGVEQDEQSDIGLERLLNKTVLIHRLPGESRAEMVALIVIAQHQVEGHGQPLQDVTQLGIGFGLAVMRQVAGYDDEFGRCYAVRAVVLGDALHRHAQPLRRVETVIGLAGGEDMQVGDVDEVEHRQLRSPMAGSGHGGNRIDMTSAGRFSAI